MNIGVLGGGQLARMLALAGYPLGLQFIIVDPSADACATGLGEHLDGPYDDEDLLKQLAEKADVVTYEFENVPAKVANYLAERTQVYPAPEALKVAQDRLREKTFFLDLGIPTAAFAPVNNFQDLQNAMPTIGYPAILKSRTMGYDGKGQYLLKSSADLTPGWKSMRDIAAIVEAFVPFQREVSVIAARKPDGDIAYYPISENYHQGGILRVSTCRNQDPVQAQARDFTGRILQALDYVGVLALELFDVDGQLLANEFAPRVHNSGHWTIEGAETSQFENHLRAILDWPLGSTAARGYAAMVNFIGGLAHPEQVLTVDNAHLHLYDKLPRPGRKVAHATICTDDEATFDNSLARLIALAEKVGY